VDLLHYIPDHWDTLEPEVITQLELPLLAVAIAAVFGLAMGIWGSRNARADAVFTAFNSSLLTVPSYALFALIAIATGTGNWPVVIGLVLYALLPVQRNTTAGIQAVRAEVVEAAQGMGMTEGQVLARVQLPLAVPIILAGVRQATASLVAIATVGAALNSDNLGRPILETLRSGNSTELISVIILIVGIGLAIDALLALVQRALSRGRITSVNA
jgi:ABC-type proline/glycine betaine transport system permease subunit